ncbi:MAG: hypothetical protein ACWIPI_01600, partial [Polaribacter sp.]
LKKRLAKYETPKTSRNSSVPPSKDENRPKANQSLRKYSGKKLGWKYSISVEKGIEKIYDWYLKKTING